MTTSTKNWKLATGRSAALVAVITALVSACATTETTRPPARIEIQEEVGFTIIEDARIGGAVRGDYEEALTYLDQDRHDEGIALLEVVAEAAPELSAPRIDLGIAHHRAGNLEAAEDNLLLALESNPNQPVAHNELGIVYRKTGRFDAARKSYEAALTIYPGFHYARRNPAILCDLYLADLNCALENYEAYMTTVPSDDEASMWISDIRYRLGQ
jgi:Flp pilus assembly protein TadD